MITRLNLTARFDFHDVWGAGFTTTFGEAEYMPGETLLAKTTCCRTRAHSTPIGHHAIFNFLAARFCFLGVDQRSTWLAIA
jgi:hypothetical protein